MTGYCDCHVHIVGPQDRYPWVASRTYTADPALLPDLQAAAAPSGVSRFVIVQPSFYGTDNSATLDAIDALGADGRGVAVVDPASVTQAVLDDMQARGIRGLRINLYSKMASGLPGLDAMFNPVRDVARRMGWHVQVIAPSPVLTGASAMLSGAGVDLVIDHYGLPATSPTEPEGQALLALVRQHTIWIKLSGPCRFGGDPMRTRPHADWLAALLDAAPDRCVWGSDWPHTPVHELAPGQAPPHLPYRALSYTGLAGQFLAALPDGAADAVMVSNPARLYGFS